MAANVDLPVAGPEAARRCERRIVFPLVHNRAPVAPSYAWSTAGVPRPPAVAGTPVASVKTTPLTMSGVAGAARSCETHPGSSASAPPLSLSFIASTAPLAIGPFVDGIPLASLPATGTRIHVAPPAVVVGAGCAVAPEALGADGVACHAASASALTTAPVPSTVFDACNGVAWSGTAKRLRIEQPARAHLWLPR